MLDRTVHADVDYWRNLEWPAAPNELDYEIYEQYANGRVLLLGSTRLLLNLCTEAWDLEPKYFDFKIRNKDWFSIDEPWDTIMIDGGLAFGKDFAERLLAIALPKCNIFIARAFLNPSWPTKYAVYFPRADELNPQPEEITVNEVYSFYIWKNLKQY